MSCWTALSLLLVGCFLVLEVDGRLSIAMHPKDAFYHIAKDILGVCSDDSSTTSAEDLTLYVEDNSHPCHSGPESDQNDDQKLDPNFGTVTSNTNGSKSFKIESTELRMYNIWCVTGSSSICSYALIYDLNITETDTALSCNLRMAKDVPNEFEIPSKVEWYMNGAPMEPPVELILTRDDFVVESNEVVAFSFPLNFEDKKLGGVYECKFNTDKQVFDYEYEVLGEIKESYIRFDPEQEQYIDGDKVEMTCAVCIIHIYCNIFGKKSRHCPG